jgi:DnaK suppressor protein
MAAKKPEKPSAKKATGATKGAAKGATKGAAKGVTKSAAKATPAAKKGAAAPKKVTAPAKKAASKPAATKATKPAGTGAKAVPPERHERSRGTPEPRRQAVTPPAQQPAPAAAAAAPRRLRPTKPTKDMYSPATGTNTSDPFPARELEKFRQLILDARNDSIEELEMLTEQLREMTAREVGEDNNAYSLHMAEQGTDAMEREKTFLQAQRTSDYVKKLGEALDRIDTKAFGICRICGLRLDSKRLLAVPVTQVCTVYKNTNKPCEPGRLHMQEMGINEEDLAG